MPIQTVALCKILKSFILNIFFGRSFSSDVISDHDVTSDQATRTMEWHKQPYHLFHSSPKRFVTWRRFSTVSMYATPKAQMMNNYGCSYSCKYFLSSGGKMEKNEKLSTNNQLTRAFWKLVKSPVFMKVWKLNYN